MNRYLELDALKRAIKAFEDLPNSYLENDAFSAMYTYLLERAQELKKSIETSQLTMVSPTTAPLKRPYED